MIEQLDGQSSVEQLETSSRIDRCRIEEIVGFGGAVLFFAGANKHIPVLEISGAVVYGSALISRLSQASKQT